MYLCHGCYQGAEAASAMKKRPGREALALSIYIFISFFSGIIFLWYHFSPVPFLYDYIPEPARTNLIFSRAFYLTVPCTYHVRPMSIRKKTPGRNIHCSFPEHDYYMVSIVSMVSVYSSSTASSSSSTSAISSIPRTSSATLSSVSPLLLSSSEESTSSSSSDSRISSEIKSSVSSFTLR